MITLSAQIESLSTRADRSWKVVMGTQEMSPADVATLAAMQNQIAFVAINPDPFTSEQKEVIENTKAELSDTGKTHSARLRGVIYKLWEQDQEGYTDFHNYYIIKMDKIINYYKSKLL